MLRIVFCSLLCTPTSRLVHSIGRSHLTQWLSQIPNIVFILADDLGYGDVGSYGHDIIPTPHINALTERGMKFSYNCKYPRESGSGIIDINKGNIEHKSTYSLLYFCSAKHLF